MSLRLSFGNLTALVVFAQAAIYLFVAPVAVTVMDGTWDDYVWIMIQFFIFFCVPLATILALMVRRNPLPISKVEVDDRRLALLALFSIGFELAYWHTIFSVDLITRRIGTEVIAEAFAALSFPQLLIIRLHDTVVIAMPALLLLVCLRAVRSSQRIAGWCLFALAIASFAAHTLLNSRLQFVLGLLLLAAVLFQIVKVELKATAIIRGLLACIAVLYALTVISNLRNVVATDGELTFAALDPISLSDDPALQTASALFAREWIHRLDCADLVQRMNDSLETEGFEWGRAWYYPVFMLYGAFSDPEKYEYLKRDAMTTAKAYLIERHTDLDLRDYYSCALSDAYANFWVFGYLIAAIYFGIAVTLVHRALSSRSPVAFIVGILAFAHVSAFELELITHLVGWVRVIPVAAVLLAINPITRIYRAAQL